MTDLPGALGVAERGMILPFATMSDGSAHLAWPQMLYNPAQAFVRGMTGQGTPEERVRDAFDASGLASVGGLARRPVAPRQTTPQITDDMLRGAETRMAAPAPANGNASLGGLSKAEPPSPRKKHIYGFHGTNAKFDRFSDEYTQDIGHHFGTLEQAMERRNVWQTLAGRNGGRLIPAKMQMENPLTLPDLGNWYPDDMARAMARQDSRFADTLKKMKSDETLQSKSDDYRFLKQEILDSGYDGIRYMNESEGKRPDWSYIAIRPGSVTHALSGRQLYSNPSTANIAQMMAERAKRDEFERQYLAGNAS